ncbi:hypothetical protein LH464_22075 [Neorhizobium sp. T786]|uniref:hypothetical protein n=1 Tax=Pseudorhizobium xiangyangii TaxID=2883104 RepID=UPI001CFFCA71|nr:hypothetical protein [Neorhizobium xiangyangii]MCB5205159.1 hypothetical protein [Neorhizobium xiangyangii]
MDLASVFALALSCTTAAPPSLLAATSIVMTQGDPMALTVNGAPIPGPMLQAAAMEEALAAITQGSSVRLGLGQSSPDELDSAGAELADGFSPCSSLAALDATLAQTYAGVSGTDEERWLAAASLHATGTYDLALASDFVAKITEIRATLPPDRPGQPRTALATNLPLAATSAADGPKEPPSTSNSADIFGSGRGQSLLIFSKE